MLRNWVSGIVICGVLAAVGCSEPDPTQPGGGFQLPPEAVKAQQEASKTSPEQMMEKMKQGDPTKKK